MRHGRLMSSVLILSIFSCSVFLLDAQSTSRWWAGRGVVEDPNRGDDTHNFISDPFGETKMVTKGQKRFICGNVKTRGVDAVVSKDLNGVPTYIGDEKQLEVPVTFYWSDGVEQPVSQTGSNMWVSQVTGKDSFLWKVAPGAASMPDCGNLEEIAANPDDSVTGLFSCSKSAYYQKLPTGFTTFIQAMDGVVPKDTIADGTVQRAPDGCSADDAESSCTAYAYSTTGSSLTHMRTVSTSGHVYSLYKYEGDVTFGQVEKGYNREVFTMTARSTYVRAEQLPGNSFREWRENPGYFIISINLENGSIDWVKPMYIKQYERPPVEPLESLLMAAGEDEGVGSLFLSFEYTPSSDGDVPSSGGPNVVPNEYDAIVVASAYVPGEVEGGTPNDMFANVDVTLKPLILNSGDKSARTRFLVQMAEGGASSGNPFSVLMNEPDVGNNAQFSYSAGDWKSMSAIGSTVYIGLELENNGGGLFENAVRLAPSLVSSGDGTLTRDNDSDDDQRDPGDDPIRGDEVDLFIISMSGGNLDWTTQIKGDNDRPIFDVLLASENRVHAVFLSYGPGAPEIGNQILPSGGEVVVGSTPSGIVTLVTHLVTLDGEGSFVRSAHIKTSRPYNSARLDDLKYGAYGEYIFLYGDIDTDSGLYLGVDGQDSGGVALLGPGGERTAVFQATFGPEDSLPPSMGSSAVPPEDLLVIPTRGVRLGVGLGVGLGFGLPATIILLVILVFVAKGGSGSESGGDKQQKVGNHDTV